MTTDKGKRKSFGSKALTLLTAVIVILSAVAVIISINITTVLLDKFDQLEKGSPDAAASIKKDETASAALLNMKKVKRWPAYINGLSPEGMIFYGSDNGKALLPVDLMFNDLGMKFDLVNSDDVFTAQVNGKKLVLELGTGNMKAGGAPARLGTASMAAEGHILASPDLLDYLDGFRYTGGYEYEALFTSYWPAALSKKYSGVRLFKLDGRELAVADIFGGKPFTYGGIIPAAADEVVCSALKDSILIKSGGQYYTVGGADYKKPVRLDISGSWNISDGGIFLYRIDEESKTYLVYDIYNKNLKKLKDLYSSIRLENGVSLADRRLVDCKTGSRFTRVDFEGLDGGVYTVISRSGKLVAQGSSSYSPDRRRLLLYEKSAGWSISDPDGRNIVRFRDAYSARWVDNERIYLQIPGGNIVYDSGKESVSAADVPLNYAGASGDGGLFYTRGNDLYSKMNGKERKIAGLPWKCDYACSAASNGPVVVVSSEADAVCGISGDKVLPLGRTELFPNVTAVAEADAGFGRNSAFSPDGNRIALLQKGDRFLEVIVAGLDDFKERKLTLDYIPGDYADKPIINLKWLGNGCLAVYSESRGWLVDLEGETPYLYEWSEEGSIADVFRLAQ